MELEALAAVAGSASVARSGLRPLALLRLVGSERSGSDQEERPSQRSRCRRRHRCRDSATLPAPFRGPRRQPPSERRRRRRIREGACSRPCAAVSHRDAVRPGVSCGLPHRSQPTRRRDAREVRQPQRDPTRARSLKITHRGAAGRAVTEMRSELDHVRRAARSLRRARGASARIARTRIRRRCSRRPRGTVDDPRLSRGSPWCRSSRFARRSRDTRSLPRAGAAPSVRRP